MTHETLPSAAPRTRTTATALTVQPESAVDRSCPPNSQCPDSMTCCPSGQSFSCCPFSDADCCPDGEHCCPSGYKCDMKQQACVPKRRLGEAPVLKMFPSALRP
ncbi:granulin-like isoform X1 [Haemaphysalis longicornis]